MKQSFKKQYHIIILVLLALVLLESFLLMLIVGRSSNLNSLKDNLQTIIIAFVFLIFIFATVVFNYLPKRIKHSLRNVSKVIGEISHGNYQFEIKPESFDSDVDIQYLLGELSKMLMILQRFDLAKADKIYEHHQRLILLMNLLSQGVLIALVNGEVKYCNDALRRAYPNVTEEQNINEIKFKTDFEAKIFAKISESLRYGNNIYDYKIPDSNYQQQVLLNGSIVRNRKGTATGGVFVLVRE